MGAAVGAQVGGEPADVDDRARAACGQLRQASLGADEGAVQDDGQDLAPGGERHLRERLLAPHRGVVDQDIDPAEPLDRGRRHAGDRRLVGHVGNAGERAPTARLDLARHGLGFRLAGARVDHDRRARRRQVVGDCPPDIARRAGDDGHAPVEFLPVRHGEFHPR